MNPGGKGANQAVAIARLGGDVAMVGRVGQDRFGDALTQALANDQVDSTYVRVDPANPTGVALIVVEETGENRIIVIGGANQKVSAQDIAAAEDLLRHARMIVMQFEIPMEVIETVLPLAKRMNVSVLVNAAPAYPIKAELIPLIDYLVVNEHEAEVLTGIPVLDLESSRQAARELVRRGARQVILTMGDQGSLAVSLLEETYVPSFAVAVVDTTAAGDAFIGGLVNSLIDSTGSMKESIQYANAAGAFAATRPGAQPSLPARKDIEKLLASAL
jgi:ribokinase